jgi:hypothetical protein
VRRKSFICVPWGLTDVENAKTGEISACGCRVSGHLIALQNSHSRHMTELSKNMRYQYFNDEEDVSWHDLFC